LTFTWQSGHKPERKEGRCHSLATTARDSDVVTVVLIACDFSIEWAAAEKVARYRHAQLSAVRLAGDISGKMDDVSLDELLVTVKREWAKLGPLIDLEPIQVPPGSRTEVA